jgi:hypothetical protein
VIQFDEAVQNVTTNSFVVCPFVGGVANCTQALSFNFNPLDTENKVVLDQLRVNPTAAPGLPIGVRYEIRVNENGQIKDASENFMGAFTTWFETLALPTVLSRSPEGITGCSESIVVVFSEPMIEASVLTGFSVNKGLTGTPTYDATTNTLTFVPDVQLPRNTTYNVTLAASMTDANANPLDGGQQQWSFTTGGLQIQGVNPTSARVGETVTVSGTCFNAMPGSLILGDVAPATITSWSDSEILAVVASNAVSGDVQVTADATKSNAERLNIAWNVGTPDNVQISTQFNPSGYTMVPDYFGGTFIAWKQRTGANLNNVYASVINRLGEIQGAGETQLMNLQTSDDEAPALIRNGFSGAFVAWSDIRDVPVDALKPYLHTNIYFQRINESGSPLGGTNGVLVDGTFGQDIWPVFGNSGTGSLLLAWVHDQPGVETDIYVMYTGDISGSSSNPDLVKMGVNPSTLNVNARPTFVDTAGGVFLVWMESTLKINVMKLNTGIIKAWASSVDMGGSPQYDFKVVADGNNGLIVVWTDYRDSGNATYIDVYAQRMDANGNLLWGANGVPVTRAIDAQGTPKIAADGLGGAYITWQDSRDRPLSQQYIQHLDPDGQPLWQNNGVPVTSLSALSWFNGEIVSDGANGAIMVWQDSRNSATTSADIYGQRFAPDGTELWGTNGIPVGVANSVQAVPALVTDNRGGAVAAWIDYRGSPSSIYMQGITPDGRR